jgi:hypothetical protein
MLIEDSKVGNQLKGVRSQNVYNSNSFEDLGLNPYNDDALSSGTCSQDGEFLEQHQPLSKKEGVKSESKSQS